MRLLEGMRGLLFPRSCVGCGASDPTPLPHLCRDCLVELHPICDPYCRRCGRPAWGLIDGDYECSLCREIRPAFDSARSVMLFEGIVAEMIRMLKYRRALWLAADLASFLQHGWETFFPGRGFDMITYVPLHAWRRRRRGYNQAALLARDLGKRDRSILVRSCLIRTIPTASQTRLTASQRLTNVRGAFTVKTGSRKWLEGKRILLVDDVMTTGATASECARALKAAGA
ncbi:MAG TPA: ComF family protein, partial [Kiritimatiellae bacterium]|nr:ComF family protein [Kiritimatiellia bacterium]